MHGKTTIKVLRRFKAFKMSSPDMGRYKIDITNWMFKMASICLKYMSKSLEVCYGGVWYDVLLSVRYVKYTLRKKTKLSIEHRAWLLWLPAVTQGTWYLRCADKREEIFNTLKLCKRYAVCILYWNMENTNVLSSQDHEYPWSQIWTT